MTRRKFLRQAAVVTALRPMSSTIAAPAEPPLIRRLLSHFVEEASPNGGVDATKSLWQKRGRGAAVGGTMFPGGIDPRYFRFEAEALYRFAARLGQEQPYVAIADGLVQYMARHMNASHPSWAIGNALELIGLAHRHSMKDKHPIAAAQRLVEHARARAVQVTTLDGKVTFRHFPCGYGVLSAKDAGWTNDLSMLGSGFVWAYELTKDKHILADAISFAEYFVQPWRPKALGADGYWRCGTWNEALASWVIGPAHFTGFESTDAYADEASWVFSTVTCIDYLTRLYRHHPDPRYLDRCTRAARWTFEACQFDDGAVGMCGRDDKWLGFTAGAIRQVAMLRPHLPAGGAMITELMRGVKRAIAYLNARASVATIDGHGVEWVTRTTSTDPLVNVAMLWASFLLGWLDAENLA